MGERPLVLATILPEYVDKIECEKYERMWHHMSRKAWSPGSRCRPWPGERVFQVCERRGCKMS